MNESDYFESDSGSSSTPESGGEKDSGGQTFLLNREVCPGMSVGDTGSFRITKVLENEYEAKYISDKYEESTEPDETEPAMSSDGGMFD